MLSFTTAQLNAWIVAFIYPVARILAFASSAPFLNNSGMPARMRLMLGLALTVALAPTLPPMPNVVPTSGQGLLILIQQILIGVGMGVSMRLVFAGIEMAGQILGSQMGLGFATFYDPLNTSQTVVIANFTTMIATLLFLSLNGHLIYFATLAQSFQTIPIGANFLSSGSWQLLALSAQKIFVIGVVLSLPVVTALLITNLALGVLNKAAPQLNLFAVGFPITLGVGFVGFLLSLGYMGTPLERFFNDGMNSMLEFALSATR
jgi:flagellar biosynthesis protein FliR